MKKKWYVIFVFLMVILIPNVSALDIADETKYNPDVPFTGSFCKSGDYTLCYNGGGIRVSVYENKGQSKNTLLKVFDLWPTSYRGPWDEKYGWRGEDIHYAPLNDVVKCKVNGNCSLGESGFSLSYDSYKQYYKTVSWDVFQEDEFKDKYLTDKTLDEISKALGVTLESSKVGSYFITIEQLYKVSVEKVDSKTGKYSGFSRGGYVGTASQLGILDRSNGSDGWRGRTMSIYTIKKAGTAFNTFLEKTGLVGTDRLLDIKSKEDGKYVHEQLTNNTNVAVSMGVFWLKDYVDVSCTSACAGKTGSSLLTCADSYCSSNSTDKSSCMTSCGVSSSDTLSCKDNVSNCNATSTICDDEVSSSLNSCKVVSSSYYKVDCVDSVNVIYPSNLPLSILAGSGFNYYVNIENTKTCTYTFDKNKWANDYAKANSTGKENLIRVLQSFNNMSTNNFPSDAETNTNDITASIVIYENTFSSNKLTNEDLVKVATISNKYEVNKNSNNYVTFETSNNGAISKQKVYSSIKTVAITKTMYALPGVCIKMGTGEAYLPSNGLCEDGSSSLNQYYISPSALSGRNNIVVNIKKPSSCLNDTNSCYYDVSKSSATCSVELDSDNKYRLYYTANNINNPSLGLSLIKNDLNDKTEIEFNSDEGGIIYGTVASSDKNNIYATCSLKVEPKVDDSSNSYCEVVLSDDESNLLLNVNTDLNGYKYGLSIEKDNLNGNNSIEIQKSRKTSQIVYGTVANKNGDIVARCSYELLPTDSNDDNDNNDNSGSSIVCLTNDIDRSDKSTVLNYCNTSSDKSKYSSLDECFDLCYLGGGIDYIYRIISLKDPFPNDRVAGSNWLGKEFYITDDDNNPALNSDAKPEYVIELSSSAIKEIKNQTASYNSVGSNKKNAYVDYVKSDSFDSFGAYYSKFINDDDVNNGGFKKYFTYIRSEAIK